MPAPLSSRTARAIPPGPTINGVPSLRNQLENLRASSTPREDVTRIVASAFRIVNRTTLPDPHAWYYLYSQDHRLERRLEMGDLVEVQLYILPLSPRAPLPCQLERLKVGTVQELVGDMACLKLIDEEEREQKLFLPLHLAPVSSN